MDEERRFWGLMRSRRCLVPTWRGWLALLAVVAALALGIVLDIYPFLAPSNPLPGGVLVVEGWAPDYTLKAAMDEYNRNHYDHFCVTGGPMEAGQSLSKYKTHAQMGQAVLLDLGMTTNQVQAVPARFVPQDRTYVAAVALRQWLAARNIKPEQLHLITEGAHARRSRLLYEKAFGSTVRVGVTAIPSQEFNPRRWWRSSPGFRSVTGEAIAYFYARFLFRATDLDALPR